MDLSQKGGATQKRLGTTALERLHLSQPHVVRELCRCSNMYVHFLIDPKRLIYAITFRDQGLVFLFGFPP